MKLPALLNNEKGYMIFLAAVLCLVTAIIFGKILPQLHMGQQVSAITNLNEYRAYSAAKKGVNVVKLGVDYTASGDFQDLIDDDAAPNGVIKAIEDVFEDGSGNPQHTDYTYWDEDLSDKVTQFVSSCLNIDENEAGLLHEKGTLDIAIIVRRGRGIHIDWPGDGQNGGVSEDDEIYLSDGENWYSSINPPPGGWTKFVYLDADDVWFFDFDLDLDPGGSDAEEKADFVFKYDNTIDTWYFSIGNNGSFRGKDGLNQLWNFEVNIADAEEPYWGDNNNGNLGDECTVAGIEVDCIEVFIVIRSTGITVAPGPSYDSGPDPTDLMLVNNANPHLPNPMRQVIEAGFYLYEDSGLKTKQFYFGKVHNLKAGDEP